MTHVTGDQARELLREFNDPNGTMRLEKFRDVVSTVAWLYGRDEHPDCVQYVESSPVSLASGGGYVAASIPGNGPPMPYTADQAVDLARALLAAAEKARAKT